MRHPLLIAWICWSFLCGGIGLGVVMIGAAFGIDTLARRWWRRYIWRRGRARREANLDALESVIAALKHLDNRFFSRGIWRVNHYMPEEDEAARRILLQAWDKLLTEIYK